MMQIEVSLSPSQVVRVWMKNALKGTYPEGAQQSPLPRRAVADSVARIVRSGLRGQTDEVVERAILQARREADSLYNIVITVNAEILGSSYASKREYMYLLGCFRLVMDGAMLLGFETRLRDLTVLFVKGILLLEFAISQVRLETFDGEGLLFPDSAAELKEMIEMTDFVLELFNEIAKQLEVASLTRARILESLQEEGQVERHVRLWKDLARTKMLADFGTENEIVNNLRQMSKIYAAEIGR